MIKHVSFDLWLTLIESHKDFKRKRAEFLFKTFNPNHFNTDEIMTIIRAVDKDCDSSNEILGDKIDTRIMYRKVLTSLGNREDEIDNCILNDMVNHINNLFLEYEPTIINNAIFPILDYLKSNQFSINLSSNTGFIEGKVLNVTLKNLSLYPYFDFLIYSDEIYASKPSANFYKHVQERSKCEKDEILHIGDNYNADFMGATNFGFKSYHITNKNYTFNDIFSNIHKINSKV